jgi:hypothetical protein
MGEKKPTVEELAQRIDELLAVLREISEDLAEVSKHLKTVGAPTSAPAPAGTAAPTPETRTRLIAQVRATFPKELEDLLTFEEAGEYIIIRPRQYLGSENFAKIASLVRSAGGEYVRAGKESHFKVPKEPR